MEEYQNVAPKNKEIFKYIEDLLVTYEFRDAQINYFDTHCKTFENTEENKHEYHDLFKEYTKILDDTIDKKLEEKYSESEIQEFYKDFTEDHKKYDVKNSWVNTVDTLFTFTDYENFKQTMIDYYEREHKGKVSDRPYRKLDVKPDFDTFHQYFLKPTSEFHPVLKGVKEDEIDSFTRAHNDTVQVFIARYTVTGVEEDTLIENFFKMDFEKIKAAMPFIKVMEEVQLDGEDKSDKYQTIYSQYEFPMMPKSESLIKTEKSTFENYQILRQNSIDHEKYPVNNDIKRTEMYKQLYCRQIPGTKNTEVVDVTFAEREIGVPPMFLTMIMAKATKTGVAYFFNEIRAKQAEKDAQKK